MSHNILKDGHSDLEGGKAATTMISLTPKEYESLFLTPKDARPPAPVTGTFANPVGIGTIALVLVILPWSLALCELGGTNTLSLFVLAPGFIFVGFVRIDPAYGDAPDAD